MPKIRVRFKPQDKVTEVERGTSLLKAAFQAGLRLEAECGGMGRCGKCRVVVTKGVSSITPKEREYLTPYDIDNKIRLACQANAQASTVVSLLSAPSAKDQILEAGVSPTVAFDPAIKKHFLDLDKADLKHEKPLDQLIRGFLEQAGITRPILDFSCLKTLPLPLQNNTGGVTAILQGRQVLGFEAGDTRDRIYGLAVDVGTTTVVGYLFDLASGNLAGVNSALNSQSIYGSDVVSRIEHAIETPQGLEQLKAEVLSTINRIIKKLCDLKNISNREIYSLYLVGNTPMNHLFWGILPCFLARFPYNPLTVKALCVSAGDVNVQMNPLGRVFSLPLISGFIGSDTVGVILSTGLHKSRLPRMAIDIGTNGEIVLTDGKAMAACSCAAGPAFEGAHIQCGMRATSGAIDRVYLSDGKIRYHVIDEVPPKGICGSGLVDAVKVMLTAGLVNRNGKLSDPEAVANPRLARLIRREKYPQMVLTGERKPIGGEAVVVTNKDISELQLAKGAMRAGINILMDKLGLRDSDIREVYLAGGFGNYVNPESAVTIGLLPVFPNAKITPVGNAAGSGAKMALLSTRAFKEAVKIAERVEHVELANIPQFQQEFAKGVLF
ncbi:MAG: ASKHA domain-containing protein [Desulfobacterales bacterium]